MKIIKLCLIMCAFGSSQPVEPFLQDVIQSFTNVRDMAISKSGNELFFTLQSYEREFAALVYLKKEQGIWQKPQIASFSGQYIDMEPFFSKDDLRLYFASNRPLRGTSEVKDFDIWYVEREDLTSPWSDPLNLGPPVNSDQNEFYPSLADNGNLYFTSDPPTSRGKDDIYWSTYKNDQYSRPVSVSDSINTAGYEFNAFVAPDESFLIFTGYNYKDGYGSGDLYISYRQQGIWTKPGNLGQKINSDKMEFCPFVDIKTQTLYFTSKRSALKTDYPAPQSLEELLKSMNIYENGLSRIYRTHFTEIKR